MYVYMYMQVCVYVCVYVYVYVYVYMYCICICICICIYVCIYSCLYIYGGCPTFLLLIMLHSRGPFRAPHSLGAAGILNPYFCIATNLAKDIAGKLSSLPRFLPPPHRGPFAKTTIYSNFGASKFNIYIYTVYLHSTYV